MRDFVVDNNKNKSHLKKHGIDFCCGGGITVEKACSKNGVDYTILRKEIEAIVAQRWEIFYWCLGFMLLALGCWGIVEYLIFIRDSR